MAHLKNRGLTCHDTRQDSTSAKALADRQATNLIRAETNRSFLHPGRLAVKQNGNGNCYFGWSRVFFSTLKNSEKCLKPRMVSSTFQGKHPVRTAYLA